MTYGQYISTIHPKVHGTWNVHDALESANIQLDYFVLISSAAGIVGSRGQGAYAAASTFLDAFAAFRNSKGLPCVAIDLTAVTETRQVTENPERKEEIMRNFGGETVSVAEVLSLLAIAISGNCSTQCLTGLKMNRNSSGALPYYASDPRFSVLKAETVAEAVEANHISVKDAFRNAPSDEAKRDVAMYGILQKLSEVLSIQLDDVDAQRTMASFGLDSLTAIEIRNWITRELGTNLQILELLTSNDVASLASLIVSRAK
jgi:acyl carrier protein